MTMSHHIFFTSCGAAYNVELSVSAASISFASLDTAIDVAAYTDEDTATVNLLAPAPSWSREVVKTPPGRDIRSQEEAVRTVKQYTVRQGFAVSIVHTRSCSIKRVFLCCFQ